jgi:hypothetical protein
VPAGLARARAGAAAAARPIPAPHGTRGGGPRGASGGVAVGVASALEKLRPGDATPPERGIDLAAPRGACESAQIAVRAASGIGALTAEAGPLRGPGRVRVPLALYRVATLPLARASGPDGAAGAWPDPLVPARDAWFGEARRAFPVAVPPGALQAIWVEACVPDDAAPGVHAGRVRLLDGARPLAEVRVRVRVWPFALPRTGTFAAAFGLPTRVGTRALGRADDPALARALAAAALRHRITPYILSADPPEGACTARSCELDWSRYDAEVGPVLDGTLVPGVRGAFAEVRIPERAWSGPEADLSATLRAWRAHFAARGWGDRLRLYTLDEAGPAQHGELGRRARLAHAAGIRVFATVAPTPALAGLVDEFAPNLVLLPPPSPPPPAAPAASAAAAAAGRREPGAAWSYASCLSHGCDELPPEGAARARMEREFTGWPGYEIDRPGTAALAVALLGVRRGLWGELYYDMLQAWTGDPWTDPRAFAGNGDGTLLYPGRPETLGGVHPFPVESIRLKIVRDALEDAELWALARRVGEGALADRLLAGLVPSARGWERRPGPWLAARRLLGEAVARRLAAP